MADLGAFVSSLPGRIARGVMAPFRHASEISSHALDLVHAVATAAQVPVGTLPKAVVWRKNKARLYRYVRATAATKKTAILCILPLINRGYILDLRPGASFVEYLLSQGHEVFLLDWGTPGDEDRGIDLTQLIERYIDRAVHRVHALSGGPLTLLGYCIGGALATCYAALHTQGLLKNLVLMTTPIDFADSGTFGTWTQKGVFPIDQMTELFPVVPSTFPDVGSKMLAPLSSGIGQFVMLEKKLRDPRFDVRGWQALYRWVNDGVAFPSAAYRQWIKEFYQGNKLAQGTLLLGGRRVLLENIRCPLLNVVATSDVIAPRSTTASTLERVGSSDKQELVVKGGHVGIVVGKSASVDLWPRLGAWLAARDG